MELIRNPSTPGRTISGSAPRGHEMTGAPQASDSANTIPNGSSHWIGTSMARACPSSAFFCTSSTGPTYSMPPLPISGAIFSRQKRPSGSSRSEWLPAMISRRPRTSRDLDRPMRALDLLDPAQEHQRRIVGHRRTSEGQAFGVREVGDAVPLAARRPAAARNVVAASREGEPPGRSEAHSEADGPVRRLALEGHDERHATAQMRQQVGDAREAVHDIRPEGPHRPRQGRSVLATVSRRDSELKPGQGKKASLGHSEPGRATSPTVWPAARSRRTSTSTMRSIPP